jgi:hypothetical protein
MYIGEVVPQAETAIRKCSVGSDMRLRSDHSSQTLPFYFLLLCNCAIGEQLEKCMREGLGFWDII